MSLPSRRLLTLALLVVVAGTGAVQGQEPLKDSYGDPLPEGAIGRLGTTRFRHDDTVVFAAFLPGGKSVLSVGRDGVVCAWEFPSGKPIRRGGNAGRFDQPNRRPRPCRRTANI